jgi:hypothetical protein
LIFSNFQNKFAGCGVGWGWGVGWGVGSGWGAGWGVGAGGGGAGWGCGAGVGINGLIHLQKMVKAIPNTNITMIKINKALFETTLECQKNKEYIANLRPMEVIVVPASVTSLSMSTT